jgi:large subunit ribosomal protein L22
MQEVTAKLKFLRIGPRKIRLIADLIRGRKAEKAVNTLSLLNKRAAKPVLKLLKSAIANAKHNHNLPLESLRVAKITVDGGPVLKRWMPKAHGRATPVRERTSHINLVLTGEVVEAKKEEKAEKKKVVKKAVKAEKK